jgi:hypothetical protein
VDFILENEKKAIEVKYNSSLFKFKKYAFFLSKYPDFSFHLLYHTGKPVPKDKHVLGHKI